MGTWTLGVFKAASLGNPAHVNILPPTPKIELLAKIGRLLPKSQSGWTNPRSVPFRLPPKPLGNVDVTVLKEL